MKRILLLILIAISLIGCKTVEQAYTTYKSQVDTVYISRNIRDSIYLKDSIYIKEKGDTIWMKEWHTKLIDLSRIDTIYVNKSDTCYVEKLETVHDKYIPTWIWYLIGVLAILASFTIIRWILKIYKKTHNI